MTWILIYWIVTTNGVAITTGHVEFNSAENCRIAQHPGAVENHYHNNLFTIYSTCVPK
jgi:hypothetical protein